MDLTVSSGSSREAPSISWDTQEVPISIKTASYSETPNPDSSTPTPTTIDSPTTTTTPSPPSPISLTRRWSREWFWEYRGSTVFVTTTVSLGIFADLFLYACIVPVIPYAFETRLGIAEENLQQQTSVALGCYSVGLVVGAVASGLVSDVYNKRKVIMVFGLILAVASSILLMLIKIAWLYMVARFIQGASGGIVWTVGLAMVCDVAQPDNIALLMSFPGLATSTGIFLGPLVGGVLYETRGYYAVFYPAYAVLAVDIIMRLLVVDSGDLSKFRRKTIEKYTTSGKPLTEAQQKYILYLSSQSEPSAEPLAEPQMNCGPSETEKLPWNATITIAGRTFRVPSIIYMAIRLRIFNALFISLILAWLMSSLDTILPLYLKETLHFNSLSVGLMFLALAGPSIVEPAIGMICDKTGPRFLISLAFLSGTAFFIMLRIPDGPGKKNIVIMAVVVALIGLCLTMLMCPIMAELSVATVEVEQGNPGAFGAGKGFGKAFSLFNVAFAIGSIIGPFQSGGVKTHSGWNTATMSLGIISGIMSILSLPFTGGNILKPLIEERRQGAVEDEEMHQRGK